MISLSIEYISLSKKSILTVIFLVFLYACSDEIHQLFIPGRSGEILDVLIDTLGGITSIVLYTKIRREKNEQKKAIS